MRFHHMVISLPILLCATQFTTPYSLAQAMGTTASEATTLLAKSHVIDVKCSVLPKDESQDLKDFVARAEISLAENESVAAARKAINEGRREGKAASCGEDASKQVKAVLAAANAAVAIRSDEPDATTEAVPEAASVSAMKAPANASPVAKLQLKQTRAAKLAAYKSPKVEIVGNRSKTKANDLNSAEGLGSYAAVAEKYYVATRCNSMDSTSINRLYKTVLSNHQQAMAKNRPVDVKAMLRTAEARAGTQSCS